MKCDICVLGVVYIVDRVSNILAHYYYKLLKCNVTIAQALLFCLTKKKFFIKGEWMTFISNNFIFYGMSV